jgi:hypothetical protein
VSVHQILCDDATFLKLTETEKGDTGEMQSQEHAHHFL